MAPRNDSPTCFLFKFADVTILLPISPSTTLSSLRTTLFQALPKDDPACQDVKEDQIGLWKGREGEWELLEDEKSGADKWGLKEAAQVGVSFAKDGTFPKPSLIIPQDAPDIEE